MEDIGSVHFRLRAPGDTNSIHIIRADVQIDGSTIFISLFSAKEGWPFIIENESDHSIKLCQKVGVGEQSPWFSNPD